MNDWESTGEIINKNYSPFLQVGKRYREWFSTHGYVDTNMGVLKKEWISHGLKHEALSKAIPKWIVVRGKKYPYYNLIVTIEQEYVKKIEGEGRNKNEITVPGKITTIKFNGWQEWVKIEKEIDDEYYRFTKENMDQYRSETPQNPIIEDGKTGDLTT
ncbi:MAG: hypothetical protein NUV98_07340 [Candidatus Roizmanbacteria bacterium]|nr:hypothetical protein [Candidatus Roizmanbacteria bacterium]